MPWIPMYLTDEDVPTLLNLLSDDREIAFLRSDGPRRWRAVERLDSLDRKRVALWHVPSGPLPLADKHRPEPIAFIEDPWAGWKEKWTGADPSVPFFPSCDQGVIYLGLRPQGSDQDSVCGMSEFGWIGQRYRGIGQPAKPETERWWNSLRRRVAKLTRKAPRQSLSSSWPPEIHAFAAAYALLEAGGVADLNPS